MKNPPNKNIAGGDKEDIQASFLLGVITSIKTTNQTIKERYQASKTDHDKLVNFVYIQTG